MLTTRRIVTPEIMDSPDIEEAAHLEALQGLARINRASGTVGRISQPIVLMAKHERLDRVSVMDVACGGGDVPIGVVLAAKNHGIQVDLTLMDRSPTALATASRAAAAVGIDCQTIRADTLSNLPRNEVDVVTNSLFLHHLSEPADVISVLRDMREIARRMVVISDLRRSRLGLIAAKTACRLLSRSPIVRHDGPASVRAAWTLDELSDFAAQAGMSEAKIQPCWPWRMLLTWERRA